ncbi:hypothetical protein VT84_34845 [Gemmata sp. SH-PL17]|uniref:BatD family protein n=1 Tax=Gemmata sp. SH-PL17 TaxID=1630693 RepID=UPI0004BB2E56|nr:BatD family protein [Gemmata sp. SH-PL17]AMV29625.1 hypothetical protein VT84_34845 [Gemmata sp. SH-PL17]
MRFIVPLLFFAAPVTAADPPPRAKVELAPKDGVWVGQRVTLAITLYTPDLFAGVPSFDMPPIPGAVVLPPSGSIVGSETIGDTSFTTQRHEFAVYAQRAGAVQIPAFAVRFESNAGFGKPTIQRLVTTASASFTAKTPPGAEGLGTVIAARDLKVTDDWKPDPKALKVGDALTRALTVTADGVPGMVFPPFRLDEIDELAAYPKEPVVNDRTERGALTGQRTEIVTYVCKEAGTVTVPDRTLTWFDLGTNELKIVKLPGKTFTVAAVPAPAPEPTTTSTASNARGRWWRVGAVLVGVTALGGFLVVRLWSWGTRRYAAWSASESAYFARLQRACRSHDAHAVFVALEQWLDRFGFTSLAEFERRVADPELSSALADLTSRVYVRPGAGAPGPWTAHQLFARIKLARRTLRPSTTRPGARALPPLNPVG